MRLPNDSCGRGVLPVHFDVDLDDGGMSDLHWETALADALPCLTASVVPMIAGHAATAVRMPSTYVHVQFVTSIRENV